ncbi:hypothetical protein [Fusobacterium polymorphum]|uniref:hypothetical protein n=1 Tax=Fusobacterium nucleatum subsp. polymorphum TaxID=76857 RepID=UPI0030095AF0
MSKEKSLMKEIDEKIIISIGLYSKFKKLNDTISADKFTNYIQTGCPNILIKNKYIKG